MVCNSRIFLYSWINNFIYSLDIDMSSIRLLLLFCIFWLFLGTTFADFSTTGMNIPKVDLVKVKNIRLSLHNIERKTKSLTPFMYSSWLESTAVTWAQHLANIGTTSHKRKITDGYYSYASIKQRFINHWITFTNKEKNGQPLFTENLAWNVYTCKKIDCTDDFIKAIKKSRTFFMSEKWKSYKPHYNAIMGNFTSIGLGVALSGNKYYLVSHYTQSL